MEMVTQGGLMARAGEVGSGIRARLTLAQSALHACTPDRFNDQERDAAIALVNKAAMWDLLRALKMDAVSLDCERYTLNGAPQVHELRQYSGALPPSACFALAKEIVMPVMVWRGGRAHLEQSTLDAFVWTTLSQSVPGPADGWDVAVRVQLDCDDELTRVLDLRSAQDQSDWLCGQESQGQPEHHYERARA